jgi:hypothetical protein
MKNWLILILILIAIALVYVYNLPPKPRTIKDIHPDFIPNIRSEESSAKDTIPFTGIKEDTDDRVQNHYYIIVESVTGELHARQEAEKLKSDFQTDFIVLPPTREGFYRISYGKYTSLEEAKNAINKVRRNIRANAWIFSEKK